MNGVVAGNRWDTRVELFIEKSGLVHVTILSKAER